MFLILIKYDEMSDLVLLWMHICLASESIAGGSGKNLYAMDLEKKEIMIMEINIYHTA